jgi:hypothetical protein
MAGRPENSGRIQVVALGFLSPKLEVLLCAKSTQKQKNGIWKEPNQSPIRGSLLGTASKVFEVFNWG